MNNVDEEARDLRRRAKEVIASATFFFFSKRLRERRVCRSLDDNAGVRNSRHRKERYTTGSVEVASVHRPRMKIQVAPH